MARNVETVSLTLDPDVRRRVDIAARHDGRTRSAFVNRILERAVSEVTGASRLEDLERIAAAAVADSTSTNARVPNPHPLDVVAASMRQWSTPEAQPKDNEDHG